MNRVLIGVIVLIVFILSLVWVGRRFSQLNLGLRRPTPTPIVLPSPLPSDIASPMPRATFVPLPSAVLPQSGGQLPATGL